MHVCANLMPDYVTLANGDFSSIQSVLFEIVYLWSFDGSPVALSR